MKSTDDRRQAVDTVLDATHEWAPFTAESLADFLRPELAAGERLPDQELQQQLFRRALARRWRRLEAADAVRRGAANRQRRRLAELAAATRSLYRRVVALRALLAAIFRPCAVRRLLAFFGRTSFDPLVLARQARRAVDRLRDATRALPPAAYEPAESDRERWARPVEAAIRDLEPARASAQVAGRELEAAVADRRRALDEFNGVFLKVCCWFEATYRAAGCPERAEAVRPSRRRPGLLLKDEERSRAAPAAGRPASAVDPAPLPSTPEDSPPGETPAAAATAAA